MPQLSASVIPIDPMLALMIEPDEGFRDPAQPPPPDLLQAGRYRSETSILVDIVAPDTESILPYVTQLLPRLGNAFMYSLGRQLARKDPQMARQWRPLAPATLKNRQAQGRQDTYPYSDRVANDIQYNRWGMDVVMDSSGGSVGMGWRGESGDMNPHRALLEAESGTGARKVGPGHTVSKVNQRPLGVTEEVAAAVTQEVSLWAKQVSSAFVPDAYSARAPLLSAPAL
jgi:hypothetical protein